MQRTGRRRRAQMQPTEWGVMCVLCVRGNGKNGGSWMEYEKRNVCACACVCVKKERENCNVLYH